MIESIIVFLGNLVLPYLLLSLVAVLLLELLSQGTQLRARTLEYAVRAMLADRSGDGVSKRVYGHPLVRSLFAGNRRPSYIPAELFALALVDEIQPATSKQDFAAAIRQLPAGELRRGLEALVRGAPYRAEVLRVHEWFNAVMDQASGWYKWRTLWRLGAIGAFLVVALNFDALRITNHIAQRDALESVYAARVEAIAADSSLSVATRQQVLRQELDELLSITFPIGWLGELRQRGSFDLEWLFLKVVGLLASILAVMIGAPLLFDLLNKFSIVRATVKPYEKMPAPVFEPPRAMAAPPPVPAQMVEEED